MMPSSSTSISRRALLLLFAIPQPLAKTLKKVEDRYNKAKTLQVSFQQTYSVPGRGRRTESGLLSLKKPGRMRWDYKDPNGKLFLSDGKEIFLYVPETKRAERMKMKEADDMRVPLAFLLGKLEFSRDFAAFEPFAEGGLDWMKALPKSDKLPYKEVYFLLSSEFSIQRLRVVGQDQSVMEFVFQNEKLNVPLDELLFRFEVPPGVELVESGTL